MKHKALLKETARDFVALGSPIFFVIVIARVALLSNYEYLSQFVIAGILFLILALLLKANLYSGLGLIVLMFTALFYNNLKFTLFGFLVYIVLLVSLIYLDRNKKEVLLGIFLGLVSTGISYWVVELIFS